MRTMFLALMLVLAAPLAAHAECAVYEESVLTPEVPVGTPVLLVEIFDFDQSPWPSDMDAVAQQFQLVTAKGVKVPLGARAMHRGMNQTQIELVPTRPLALGEHRLQRTTRPAHTKPESHTLKVVASPSSAPVAAPQVLTSTYSYQELGCGPGEAMQLTLASAGPYYAAPTYERPRLVLVTLTRQGRTERGYVRLVSEDGKLALSVGHGMCSGEFRPMTGATYQATLQLVLPDGTLGPATTLPLTYAAR